MSIRAFASTLLFTGLAGSAASQGAALGELSNQASSPAAPAATAVFEVVDVHPSPHPGFMRSIVSGRLVGERYVIRQATMPQLIAAAYDYDSSAIVGGPIWLDMDRFDVTAKVPAQTPPATLKLMMRAMLKDRFSLMVHEATAPMPAYVLRVVKEQPSFKETAGSAEAACNGHPSDTSENGVVQIVMSCHNQTMAQFAHFLQSIGGAGYLNQPVIDSTGLKAAYDFEFKWTPRMLLSKAGSDGITLFDALEKQLGLKLALETAPRQVLMVDRVNETPTSNPPGTEKSLPPAPQAQFEVSTIRPSKPDTREMGGIRGDMVNVQGMTLRELISFAWDINPVDTEGLVGAPAWLDKDKFDIVAKVAGDEAERQTKEPQIDIEQLQQLVRGLIADRFKMQAHTEVRPVTAYTLVAAGAKIKPAADPSSRRKCTEGPGPDGKDPRTTYPIRNRLIWCQNMTMAEFAKQLQYMANGFIYYPVLDGTGLKGGWDFLLNFSSIQQTMPGSGGSSGGAASAGSAAGTSAANNLVTASDPSGALSLFDAVKTELGLKLEKGKRPEPVLVIDHIDEQPTEN